MSGTAQKAAFKKNLNICWNLKQVQMHVMQSEDNTLYLEIEVDKPGQGILVHGVDVGQVRDHKEQHTTVLCNLKNR